MKKLFLMMILSSSAVFAALPPFYQSSKEIMAILSSEELHNALGSGEIIQKITRNSRGYTVISGRYCIEVDVEYIPREMIGPVAFDLHFHDPVPLQRGFSTKR
ncbi:MAG: hypothetical protein JW769_03520 [Parachlamydiales bacterium]|nr:hypothetical protein [Parachlamydiales bacterium]